MTDFVPIDASRARNDFFNILMRAYKGETFLVKKGGIPVAKISKPELTNKRNILEFAGALKKLNEKEIINYIYKARKDSSYLKRKLPSL